MNIENREKYLPIGSVVLLKNGKKRIMITGFCIVPKEDSSKIFDYTGCLFPEGVIDSKQSLMFNHSDIDKIFFIGLDDSEEQEFKKKLKEVINKDMTQTKASINNVVRISE